MFEEDDPSQSLTEEQQEILDLAVKGESVFFTGCAGTGKSFLLRKIKKALKARFGPYYTDKVAVTATTGRTWRFCG